MPVSSGLTVILHEAARPLELMTIIEAVPDLMPLTTPEEETVAILVSVEIHVSVVVALEGFFVGVKVTDCPSTTDSSSGRDMSVSSTGFTVILQEAG